MTATTQTTANMTATMNGQMVKRSADGKTIWVRIPEELAAPIEGGCQCSYCTAHPDRVPRWDAICIAAKVRKNMNLETVHTVHFPDFTQRA